MSQQQQMSLLDSVSSMLSAHRNTNEALGEKSKGSQASPSLAGGDGLNADGYACCTLIFQLTTVRGKEPLHIPAVGVCGSGCPWLGSSGSCKFGGSVLNLGEVIEAKGWDGGCMRSSGGGTGKTTGLEELDSLLMSSTWMGPEWLFRLIWYFFCPFKVISN